MVKYLFNRKSKRSNELLGLIYTSIRGSMTICVIDGYIYILLYFFMTINYNYGYVYLMKLNFKLFERFKEFRNDIEKQAKMTIKIF